MGSRFAIIMRALILFALIFSVTKAQDKNYEISSYSMDWYAARQYCQSRSKIPVKILDSATQTAAASYLNQVNPSGSGLYWIGLSDLAQEGRYLWDDGTVATYFSWASGEPNDADGSSDCIHMDYSSKGRGWTDSGCFSYNIYAFCQTA